MEGLLGTEATGQVVVNMRALQRYVRPQLVESWSPTQVAEYYGSSQQFYCAAYGKLQKELQGTQKAFQAEKNLEEKKKIATAELQLWRTFVSSRLADLPAHFNISKLVQSRLERTWQRIARRRTLIPAAEFLEFFTEYNKHYTGDFPFDQTAVTGLVHPYHGHLTRLPNLFHWQQFLHFLRIEALASYERKTGQQLPAKQLSSYNIWTALDTEHAGHLDFPRFQQLLQALHIPTVTNFKELRKELTWTMRDLPQELEGMSESKAVLRFELVRRLFLERNE